MSNKGNLLCECGRPSVVQTSGSKICVRCADIEKRTGSRHTQGGTRNATKQSRHFAPMAEGADCEVRGMRLLRLACEAALRRRGLHAGRWNMDGMFRG